MLAKIFSDPIPANLEVAYLFGQTKDNEASVLEKGVEIFHKGIPLAISRHPGGTGYPGFPRWKEYFKVMHVNSLFPIPQENEGDPVTSTLIEAKSLVSFMEGTGITRFGIVSSPFHQLRAFFTVVSEIVKVEAKISKEMFLPEDQKLRVYSIPGMPLPWHEEVLHSQGVERGTREAFLTSDWEKTKSYINKRDLVDSSRILEYLEWRDG